MAELTQLVQLLQQQIAAQQKNMEAQQQQHQDAQQHQIEESRKQMEALITAFTSMKDKQEPEQPKEKNLACHLAKNHAKSYKNHA